MARSDIGGVYRLGVNSQEFITGMREIGALSEQTFQRMRRAAEPANVAAERLDRSVSGVKESLRATASNIAFIDGPLGGVASRINALATAIGRIGIAGAALGVGLAGGVYAMSQMVSIGEEAERSQLRLAGILRATGHAAGFASHELDEMARTLGIATLTSANEARDAIAILLTFRSIAGDTFREVLKLSQDVSENFGQSLKSSIVQIGKATEDPIQGLTALRRMGISFGPAESQNIRELVEENNLRAAQQRILAGIRGQVGDAGEAAAAGLTGQRDTFGEQFRLLMENLAEATQLTDAWAASIGAAADAAGSLNETFFPRDLLERLRRVNDEIAQQRRLIDEGPPGGGRAIGGLFGDSTAGNEEVLQRLLAEKAEIEQLLREQTQAENEARAGQRQAEADRLAEAERERAEGIEAVISQMRIELDVVGMSNAQRRLRLDMQKEMADATAAERDEYMALARSIDEATAAHSRRDQRRKTLQELELESRTIGLSPAEARIRELMAPGGSFHDATAEEAIAMQELVRANQARNDELRETEALQKRIARNDDVISGLREELRLRQAQNESVRRLRETLAALGDDATPQQLVDALDLLRQLDIQDQREQLEAGQIEWEQQREGIRSYIEALQLELDAFGQTNAERRIATALVNELANAYPEEAAAARSLIEQIEAASDAYDRLNDARRASEQAQGVIDDLQRSIDAVALNAEQQALAQRIAQSGLSATDPLVEKIRELNAELFRLQDIAANAPVPRDRNAALDERQASIMAEQSQAFEEQAQSVEQLVYQLYPAAEATEKFRTEMALLQSTVGQDMLQKMGIDTAEAMERLRLEYADTSSFMFQVMQQASTSISNSIANMVRGARISLSELATDLAAFTVQSGIQQVLNFGINYAAGQYGSGSAGPATQSTTTGGAPTRAQLYHQGGIVGDGAPSRMVPAGLFAGAPRYHDGLFLRSDERPAILQTGEQVIPRGGSAAQPVELRIKVDDDDGAVAVSQEQTSGGGRSVEVMIKSYMLKSMGSAEFRKAMQMMYGLRPRTA